MRYLIENFIQFWVTLMIEININRSLYKNEEIRNLEEKDTNLTLLIVGGIAIGIYSLFLILLLIVSIVKIPISDK